MEAITITLNGVEVSGYAGMTALELARESGVEIPTLCHDPHLSPAGACRVCIVEEERSGTLVASCVTPIAPGMIINTRSPRVLERRKAIVKLLLASHPDSCFVCDKGNRCELRKIASDLGIGRVEFRRLPQPGTVEEINPFIVRDLSRCILCARCIRVDHELVVEGAIDYINRGIATRPATLNSVPLEDSECTFCGACVAACPTGALMEKQRAYGGTTATTHSTVCPFCGCGCNLSLEVKDNRLVRATPSMDTPVNHGTLCARGSYGFDFVHSQERLTHPLIRVGGDFQTATWEQALDLVATEFQRIRAHSGPDSLAILGSSKSTNEENYLLQRFARTVLGTNNIDNGSRLYSAASRVGLGRTIGFPGTTNSLGQLENSEVIMVIGADPTVSAPVVGYAIKRAVKYKGAKLLLVDPRQTKLAAFAHQWLRPRIGSDVTLLNGLARVLIAEKLYDEEYVALKTDNFEGLSRSLESCTPDHVEETTGVPWEEVEQAARIFAGATRASIVYGNGITQNADGVDAVTALAHLAMLTGNIQRRGSGIFALQRENNAQGACDMGALPEFLPGYQSLDNPEVRRKFEERWGGRLPVGAGLTALEMLAQARAGKVRGMLVVGENPALSFPGRSWVEGALTGLDCLVVADMFLTETARLARVVLPAASFAEKEGTFTNFEGRLQEVRQAISPIGESLADGEMVLRLASKLGSPMPYSLPQHLAKEIEVLVPLYQRAGYADSESGDTDLGDSDSNFLGARRLYKGPFPSGFSRFYPLAHKPPANGHGEEYPFTLISGTTLYHFGTGSRSLRAPRLKEFSGGAFMEINEADASRLGIRTGDVVKVTSPEGAVNCVARTATTLPVGALFMPMSFPESSVNSLFGVVLDPETKGPCLKTCAVRLDKVGSNG